MLFLNDSLDPTLHWCGFPSARIWSGSEHRKAEQILCINIEMNMARRPKCLNWCHSED